MSKEAPKRKIEKELPTEVLLSKEHLGFKMIPFETALGYMTEVAIKNKSEDPEIIVIFGNHGAGKTYFSKKLVEAVHEKTKESPVVVYPIDGWEEVSSAQIKKWQKDNPNMRLSMIVVQSPAPSINSGPDIGSARDFKKFPSMILYIFDPQKEHLNQDLVKEQLANLVRERRQYSENFNVPYITPEVYFVENPREEK